jgi:flagellar basal body-associated protein FliL
MAMSKQLGTIFLAVGLVVLLGGLAAAVFGYVDQNENNQGTFNDNSREQTNQQMQIGGTIAAIVGLLLVIIGVVPLAAART